MPPRITKEPTQRRSDIIASAQRFMTTKGFEQTTIQDILDDLHISKGAFYHYFDSKATLLDALIEHMVEQIMPVIVPIMEDPALPAIAKLERFFDVSARWKAAQKPFMLALLHVWYRDENALVRQKQTAATLRLISPLIAQIICQGVQEGVFNTPYPEQMGEVALVLMVGVGDSVAGLLMNLEEHPDALQRMTGITAVYTATLERALGAQPGSLHLFDPKVLEDWFLPPVDT